MSITNLSTEILQRIYESCDLIDVLHLSQTSKRNYNVLRGRYIYILGQALDNSFGPIPSLVKLAISNETEKKTRRPVGTEIRRNELVDRIIQTPNQPPLSIELMSKTVKFGRVASRWIEIFPQFRWRADYKNRRFLRSYEQRRLRRAIYLYWTYSNLFHDQIYTQFNDEPPLPGIPNDPRLRLLRAYSTIEIIQLSEFLHHVKILLERDLYPSNSVVRTLHNFSPKEVERMGWGNGWGYWEFIDDLLKYNPIDLLHLFDKTFTKSERAGYLKAQGLHFNEHPATLKEALTCIALERAPAGPKYENAPIKQCYVNSDENVRFGIADYDGGEVYSDNHPYYNDANYIGTTN